MNKIKDELLKLAAECKVGKYVGSSVSLGNEVLRIAALPSDELQPLDVEDVEIFLKVRKGEGSASTARDFVRTFGVSGDAGVAKCACSPAGKCKFHGDRDTPTTEFTEAQERRVREIVNEMNEDCESAEIMRDAAKSALEESQEIVGELKRDRDKAQLQSIEDAEKLVSIQRKLDKAVRLLREVNACNECPVCKTETNDFLQQFPQ